TPLAVFSEREPPFHLPHIFCVWIWFVLLPDVASDLSTRGTWFLRRPGEPARIDRAVERRRRVHHRRFLDGQLGPPLWIESRTLRRCVNGPCWKRLDARDCRRHLQLSGGGIADRARGRYCRFVHERGLGHLPGHCARIRRYSNRLHEYVREYWRRHRPGCDGLCRSMVGLLEHTSADYRRDVCPWRTDRASDRSNRSPGRRTCA